MRQTSIAIDIGGSTTKIALVSPEGSLGEVRTVPTVGPDAAAFVRSLPLPVAEATGIGVSIAGFVNDDATAMIYNPNLPWLQNFPLKRAFQERFGIPVVLDADSNAACLAEHRFGVGRGVKRFLCLTIGTGVGGGMIVDGRIVRLAYGGLGDIGHVIVEPFGAPCGSGCRGCAEALISAPGIELRAGKPVRAVIEAARAGDLEAKSGLAEAGRLLGIAIASQAVILFPDVVAIAGGVSEAGDDLLGPARESFAASTGEFYRNVRIQKAALGWQASLVGAAVPLLESETGEVAAE